MLFVEPGQSIRVRRTIVGRNVLSQKPYRYQGESACVTWDERLCLHVAECTRAEGDLFVTGREPWCIPDLVELSEVREVVERCPSGALHYEIEGGPEEVPDSANTVVVVYNGPLYLRGALKIDGTQEEMPGVKYRAALCRCGKSKRKPFCDNAHEASGFRDSGAVGQKGDETATGGDVLRVKGTRNGPLLFSGNFTIVAATGRRAWRGSKAALCRCGQSANKPFCDGSHKTSNFEAEETMAADSD